MSYVRYALSGTAATIFLVFLATPAFAQQATSVTWSSRTYFQGDNGSVSVILYNQHSYQICTKEMYLQFDWQQAQNTVWSASDAPCIATGQSHTFTIQFSIPADASVGYHNYKINWVDSGFLLGIVTVDFSVSFNVHDANERVYDGLYPQVNQAIQQGQSANYQSPTAEADLSQAVTYYNQATTLANQGQWQQAVGDLNQASSYASQAYSAEQSYLAAQQSAVSSQSQASSSQSAAAAASAQTNLTLEVGIAIVVLIIIVGFVLLSRRKKVPKTPAAP